MFPFGKPDLVVVGALVPALAWFAVRFADRIGEEKENVQAALESGAGYFQSLATVVAVVFLGLVAAKLVGKTLSAGVKLVIGLCLGGAAVGASLWLWPPP